MTTVRTNSTNLTQVAMITVSTNATISTLSTQVAMTTSTMLTVFLWYTILHLCPIFSSALLRPHVQSHPISVPGGPDGTQ